MSDLDTAARKARAEVEVLVDEVVETVESGVTHPDGSPGFEPGEAVRLRSDLQDYADATIRTAVATGRGRARTDDDAGIRASIDAVLDTLRRGVLDPGEGPGFGPDQAAELREGLSRLAHAIADAADGGTWAEVDAAIEQVVRSIRSGLFLVYGRASYAAITGDQLEAYLETFADAVLAVVERDQDGG